MKEAENDYVTEHGDGRDFHVLGYPRDIQYLINLHDWVRTASDSFRKEPAYWGAKELWLRERMVELRKKFVETGAQAKSLKDLGFEYNTGAGK